MIVYIHQVNRNLYNSDEINNPGEKMAGKWDLSEKDFETALLFHEKEKIEPVTLENLFRGALYSMLSSKEIYSNLIKAYNGLLNSGLDTPDAINASGSRLTDIIKKAGYAKKKESYIRDFAEWWQNTDLHRQMIADIEHSREREFELRNEIAFSKKGAPGLGPKCASLLFRMCGYENLVPVDTRALKYLIANGYDIQQQDRIGRRGIARKYYLKYEEWLSDIAHRYGKKPGIFQLAVWCKESTWHREEIKLTQRAFDFDRLFIPLKKEFFDKYWAGAKTVELRGYDCNFNEKTVYPGRAVELRNGYSGQALWGKVGEVATGNILEVLAKFYYKEILPCSRTLDDAKKTIEHLITEKEKYIAFEIIC